MIPHIRQRDLATDDGLCSAAEQNEAVRVTVEGSVGVSAVLTMESIEKETVGAAAGVYAQLLDQKHAKPSPKKVANKSSKEVIQTRSISKAQVQHQGKAPVWNDFLLYRIWGSKAKINNSAELINEVEGGNLIIVRRVGTVANYSTMISLSRVKPVPASTPLKREEFTA